MDTRPFIEAVIDAHLWSFPMDNARLFVAAATGDKTAENQLINATGLDLRALDEVAKNVKDLTSDQSDYHYHLLLEAFNRMNFQTQLTQLARIPASYCYGNYVEKAFQEMLEKFAEVFTELSTSEDRVGVFRDLFQVTKPTPIAQLLMIEELETSIEWGELSAVVEMLSGIEIYKENHLEKLVLAWKQIFDQLYSSH